MAGSNNYKIIVSAEINTAEIQKQLNNFSKTAKIKVDSNSARQATKDINGLSESWGRIFSKFSQWQVVSSVIHGSMRAVRDMVESVYELDTALTEFNKVTDLSEKQLEGFIDKAYEAGEALGKSGTEVVKASTEFAKSGFDESQSLELGKIALLYGNIADEEISAGQAATFLISQMKAFGIEAGSAVDIVDQLNEVSNRFSVSSSDLSSAVPKVAATMAQAGNSMSETLALLTAGTEMMPNQAGRIARGLRSVTLNLQGMNDEGEKDVELTYKMNEAFGKLGIDLEDKTTGQIKSTFQILKELSEVFPTLETDTKNYYAALIGGKTQVDVVNSVLRNFGTALSANDVALNASGSAMRENEKYMQSMEAKLNELKSAFENFSRKTLDSDFLKAIIDVGTALIKFADSDLGRTIISVIALASAVKVLSVAFKSIVSMQGVKSFLIGLSVVFGGLTSGATGASIAMSALTKTMMASPLFVGSAIVAGIFAIVTAIDKFTISLQEQKQIVEDLTSKISGLRSEYDSLASKSDLTGAERNRLDLLTAEISANETLLIQEKKKEYARSNRKDISPIEFKGNENRTRSSDVGKVVKGETTKVFEQVDAYNELNSVKADSIEQDNKQKETKAELMASFIEEAKNLQETKDVIGNLTPEDEKLLLVLNSLISAYNTQTKSVTENGVAISDVSNVVSEYASKLEDLDEWQDKMADGASMSYSEMSKFKELYPELSKNIIRTNSGWSIEVGVLENLRKQSYETAKGMLEAEKEKTLMAVSGTNQRIRLIALEAKSQAEFIRAMQGSAATMTNSERIKMYDSYSAFMEINKELEKLSEVGYKSTVSGGKPQTEQKAKKEVDTWKAAFDAFYKDLQYRRDKDIISDEQYYDELAKANQKYFANKKEYLDDFKKYDIEVYEYLKKKEIELAEERKKALLASLEHEKERLEATLSIYEKYAEGRANSAQKEIDRLNGEKDSLQELNDEREDAIRLQELEDALAKAKTRQVRIYREGKGFVYEQDSIAVSDAQKNLEEYKRQESLKKEQDRIESEIKLWEEEKKKWSEVVSNYKEQQDLLLAEQISGISLEKLNHDTRLANLSSFVSEYNRINSELKNVNTGISNISSGGSQTSGGKLGFDPNVDYQALINGATSQAEKDYYNQQRNEKIDAGYGGVYDKNKWAAGTANYQGGALVVGKNVGEHGREIITPPKGSGIIPNPLTERLMDFGRNPLEFLSNIIRRPSFDKNSSGQSVVENYNITGVNVNANNATEFLSSIKTLAVQRTTNRK